MAESRLAKLRKIALALPEATEEFTWESPNFRVRKKIFVMAAPDGSSISMKADPDERPALLENEARFYLPPYVATKGWIGMHLTAGVDWSEVAELVTTSYCIIAPKTLARLVTSS
jgi:predicted DNA-binding protein (MmcQ/YjbR family)